jgi:hypothetical protein
MGALNVSNGSIHQGAPTLTSKLTLTSVVWILNAIAYAGRSMLGVLLHESTHFWSIPGRSGVRISVGIVSVVICGSFIDVREGLHVNVSSLQAYFGAPHEFEQSTVSGAAGHGSAVHVTTSGASKASATPVSGNPWLSADPASELASGLVAPSRPTHWFPETTVPEPQLACWPMSVPGAPEHATMALDALSPSTAMTPSACEPRAPLVP